MSLFWTEEIIDKLDLSRPQLFNDSKTPSGAVHMGSPISPMIHDAILKQVIARGGTGELQFGFDDFDVIDGLAPDLMPTHQQYFGVPLFKAPPPPGSSAVSFADHYIENYKAILSRLNIHPPHYRTSEVYLSGEFDGQIRLALDGAVEIRRIYKEISGSDKGEEWYPLQVICQNCGKLGTTKVVGWDGTEVNYRCEPAMVTWAQGCGHEGKMSPFGGNGKMPWRVEWAAKWAKFGVTLEAAGKDHASKGSSFDVCTTITREVFRSEPPVTVGHEFILQEGQKMSSSKGIGIKGLEFAEALPTTLVRYFYIRSRPNLAIDARPLSEMTPRLFDDFDRLSAHLEDEASKVLWQLSALRPLDTVVARTIRFSTIAQWIQMPNVDVLTEAEVQLGGELSPGEREVIESKMKWSRYWLDHYASEEDKFEVQSSMPAVSLTDAQREYVGALARSIADIDSAEDLQQAVYETAKSMQISSRDAFASIYWLILNRPSGPKAGWLLHSLDRQFVVDRLMQGAQMKTN